jgi:hypothetical protein
VGAQLAPLVERELELETVERLLAGAGAGFGGAVVFEGPAGIGKSSLLAAARTAAGIDLRVLSARGGELEHELPFGIVRQLLEPVVVTCDADEREALLAGAAVLAEPVLFAADPEASADQSFSALHGLYWLTVNLADAQPLLHVGHFRLRLEDALGRVHEREHCRSNGEHDRARDHHLRQGEARFSPQTSDSHHCAFLVLTVMSRASSGNRFTAPLSAAPRLKLRVTSTWITSVLFGLVGSGWIDQRRV